MLCMHCGPIAIQLDPSAGNSSSSRFFGNNLIFGTNTPSNSRTENGNVQMKGRIVLRKTRTERKVN